MELHIKLPAFLIQANTEPRTLIEPEARMDYVLELMRINMATEGGPFAAAVFERDSGLLIAAGANRVVPSRCSAAHAEMLALSLAQAKLGHHDLGADGLPACELVTSAEPCVMCLGAVIWSGVRSLVCAARSSDVGAIGFDEGPRPENWINELEARGITVTTDLLRDAACTLLHDYIAHNGVIYNARRKVRK
ncbi:nucleoside deaminase [Nitrosomonas sp. HPC101]|uniref:nucleoside deaminase n=1 Tax=Nitrosomonas sp. HPC101 TaxID=1658667 RepID=UPI0013684765|nr:nucleoside deaminase [Nitrosomonas sp. HPC101]MXS86377.1 nucleoside deaminase [Nitrosomonas sp. HPC101]